MFRRSPRRRASQASARVRAPQWIQHFVEVAQKLSDIGMTSCTTERMP